MPDEPSRRIGDDEDAIATFFEEANPLRHTRWDELAEWQREFWRLEYRSEVRCE